MKKHDHRTGTAAAGIAALLLLAGCGADGAGNAADGGRDLVRAEDTVLVEVDGEPVTLSMLEFLMEVRDVKEGDEQGMRQLLDELIRIRAMANEAEVSGLADEEKIRAERAIKDMELLYLRYSERYQRENPLEESRMREVYERQIERAGDTQYRFELVAFDSQQAAARAAARINDGAAGFADLEGNVDLPAPGWADRSQVPENIAAELASASAGDVLPVPLEVKDAWAVVRVAETRPLEQPEFSEVKEGIARTLNRQRVQALIDEAYENAEIVPKLQVEDLEE